MIVPKPDFNTVVVVGTREGETNALVVKAKHIKRLKHYALTICLTVLLLAAAVIFLLIEIGQIKQERIADAQEIARLKSQIPAPADTAEAQTYIQNIEDKLKKINHYLTKRGLPGFSVKDIGGNDRATATLSREDAYALYNERLEELLMGIAFTPMGYPANFIINSRFGYRSNPMGRGGVEFHSGIDFKGRRGDIVKSTAAGKVIVAGWFQGYGKCVKIRHKNNLETLYGHLSKINVKKGETITAGQIIGRVGSTGRSTGNHLHYEVHKNGKPVNPRSFLSFN